MTDSRRPMVGYARVSTTDQNLDLQTDALKDYGVPEEMIYTDKMTGSTLKRPGLKEAMRMAIHLKAEFVVWKFDRLGRTVVGVTNVVNFMEEHGVAPYSLTERIDLGTPMGKAIFHIMAAVAQMERDLIKERTIAGMKSARERGIVVGRKPSMTPEREAKAIEMIKEEKPVKAILAELQKMEGPTIGRTKIYNWIKEYRDRIGPDEISDDH